LCARYFSFFISNDPAIPEIYALSLHDALPIFDGRGGGALLGHAGGTPPDPALHRDAGDDGLRAWSREASLRGAQGYHLSRRRSEDRKSTRLNSSHVKISYAVFCLKKKKNTRVT